MELFASGAKERCNGGDLKYTVGVEDRISTNLFSMRIGAFWWCALWLKFMLVAELHRNSLRIYHSNFRGEEGPSP